MRIGDIEVLALSDGVCRMPPGFYVGLDFGRHAELLDADGTVHIPIGCFVVRTAGKTVLVDAGLGKVEADWATGGELPAALRSAGVAPADIDIVVCTHLHIDHIGWLATDDGPFFPNASVRYGTADWAEFVEGPQSGTRSRQIMQTLAAAGRLEPMDGDMVAIAPGLTGRHTPGHTLGHYGLVISSGTERAILLGDAVECPLQLEEPDFHALSAVDPALAARTRTALWRELEGTPTLMGAAHFPGLEFGRVMAGEGKRLFVV